MQDLGKLLVVFGAVIAVAGVMLWSGIGRNWLGRLPGDIHVTGEKFSFHFPLITCLLVSVVLTLVFWLVRKL